MLNEDSNFLIELAFVERGLVSNGEWHDNQKKPSCHFRKLLQERIDKANPLFKELTKDEITKLAKLEAIQSVVSEHEKFHPYMRNYAGWLLKRIGK